MNEEQELRDGLEAITVPPSRLEMAVLIQAGRRRAFRRRSIQAAGGAAMAAAILVAVPAILTRAGTPPTVPAGASATSASASATASPSPCRMEDLPVPAGMKNAKAVAVDPTGRYIVGNNAVGQDFRPILWTDGQPQSLPVPGKSVQVTAVNASGVLVGLVEDRQQEYVFRYENGTYTRLHSPVGSWHPYPTPAINAGGDVVINVEPRGNVEGKDSVVLLWKAGSTVAVRLPLPVGANAFDITDDGTIIGGIYKNGRATAAYAWDQQGNGRLLEVPAGQTAVAYAAEGDWATGGMWPSRSTVLWNLRTGKAINLEPARSGAAGPQTQGPETTKPETTKPGTPGPGEAVNASGWVVAAAGAVLRDGRAVELAVPNGQTSHAVSVSDTGLVVGHALVNGRNGQNLGPRMWRC